MSGKVYPLKDNQALAVDPRDSVWLSASAGTGKTQVLSARVLRLLLSDGVRPEQILCLTFTKAGSAEMAQRVNEVLASWVRLDPALLGRDLLAIGADNDPATIDRARTLFARVLECPGGGLRIDTIHAFAQWLLAAFPNEAGLDPGTRPMEDRDRELLAHRTLAELLEEWEENGDRKAIEGLEALSVRLGPDGARAWLTRCASARETWEGPAGWQPPMAPRVRRLLGLGEDESLEQVVTWCGNEMFDTSALKRVQDAYVSWATKSADTYIVAIENWLAMDAAARLDCAADLRDKLFNAEGQLKYANSILKFDPDIADVGTDLFASLQAIISRRALLEFAAFLTPALEVGRRYAIAWEEAKAREGLVDFDDLIRLAAGLLATTGLGEWIRYKLDREIDHILVDEAQDTNESQWQIIDALAGDFFTGEGQRDGKLRTIFVVGDYKQAIFGFQGTSPENFAAAKQRYKELMAVRAENAAAIQANIDARELVDLDLGRSYRTAQDVLTFVDDAVEAIGWQEMGLKEPSAPHFTSEDRPGLVTLWQPVKVEKDDSEGEGVGPSDGDEGAESWISAPDRVMADKIASQVRQWMRDGFPLVKGKHRNAGPGDVMVLVRKRRELAGLIVARLYAAGVPVAGVDRLRLGAPLAVKDLIAALRFAAQPGDSLSLAALLVSPIFGWSQEQLLEHGYRKGKISLWEHLGKSREPFVAETVSLMGELLALADFEPPQALLHWMLVGKWQARRKLTARLGTEANDPIDELLNAALAYAASYTPSLQGFIQWFDAGAGELKRDAGEGGGQVRVMTVHGSKGLQAPIVILADAVGNPHKSPPRGLELQEQGLPEGSGVKVPVPMPKKDEKAGPLLEAEESAQARELEEHWRLLYVALTRAEEALFIGGALAKNEKAPNPDSWFARLQPLFDGDGLHDPDWGARWERGEHAQKVRGKAGKVPEAEADLPLWAITPVGAEPRPPRPLAPSAAGEDQGADPPLPPEAAAIAARRGVLMHSLLERLPDIAPEERAERGRAWLERQAGDLAAEVRTEMLDLAMAVIAEPRWADLFGPNALAEVPLAATVEGQVIAGTADRLLVEEGRVLVADFKTARRPPARLEDMPESVLKQMGAYAAALEVIFPGRAVEAVVLYTQTPQLIAIPGDMLASRKPRLAGAE